MWETTVELRQEQIERELREITLDKIVKQWFFKLRPGGLKKKKKEKIKLQKVSVWKRGEKHAKREGNCSFKTKQNQSLGARRSLLCSRTIIVIFRGNTVPSALLPICQLT